MYSFEGGLPVDGEDEFEALCRGVVFGVAEPSVREGGDPWEEFVP